MNYAFLIQLLVAVRIFWWGFGPIYRLDDNERGMPYGIVAALAALWIAHLLGIA
jgi:hypothetical protein